MKKLLTILLLFAIAVSALTITACNNSSTGEDSSSQNVYHTSSRSKASSDSSTASSDSVDSISESSSSSDSVSSDSAVDEIDAAYVIGLINSIGEITRENFSGKLSKIEETESAYGQLSTSEKNSVVNYSTLTKARTDYNAFKSQYDTNMAFVNEFKTAVSEIETYEFSTGYKTKLDNADIAYGKIDEYYKSLVSTEKQTLDSRKSEYLTDELGALPDEVKNAILAIDDIGTVSADNFAQKLNAILAAEAAYALVDEADRTSVNNYNLLTAARQSYNEYYNAEQAILLAIEDFKTKVDEITVFEDSTAYKTLLDNAKTAYEKIPSERRSGVSAEKSVLDARTLTYNDTQAVKSFMAIYNALPDEEISQENRTQFSEAVTSFETLSATQKDLIDSTVKTAVEDFKTDLANLPRIATTYIIFDGTNSANTPVFNAYAVSHIASIAYTNSATGSGKIGGAGYSRGFNIPKTTSNSSTGCIEIIVPAGAKATIYFTGSATSSGRSVFIAENQTSSLNNSIAYFTVSDSGGNIPSGKAIGDYTYNDKTYASVVRGTVDNTYGQSSKSWWLCATNPCYVTFLAVVIE